MTDFKVGEDAWYFEFPEDGCGGFDVSAIELKCKKKLNERDLQQLYLNYSYHSCAEAINAMFKRLAEISNECLK
jgi:hypothetical protein